MKREAEDRVVQEAEDILEGTHGTTFFDKEGKPMHDVGAWAKLHQDLAYRRVAETDLPSGRWVSTVWLGTNHRFGPGKPLIFETMVFPSRGRLSEEICERYSTEQIVADLLKEKK
jgi:hypothetical protein